MKIHYQKTIKH